MTDQIQYNNNIGLIPPNTDIMNMNQLINNNVVPLNNYNNLSPYIDTNLNINNLLLLNSNNNISNINLNNQIRHDVNNYNTINKNIYNNKNNYYNNMNNNYYQTGNNNKSMKPYLSPINMLLISPSLTKATDLIYKDLQQIENILSNYKYYIMMNNYEAINMCLKYILEANFFFNQVVTLKIGDIFKNIIYSNNNNDEVFKNELKGIFQKMIPFNMRQDYLREYFNQKGEKNMYNLFKKDLNIYKNYKDKIYYLYEIFETVKYKLNNKYREELKNAFNKYNYGFNNHNYNAHNYNNSSYYNDLSTNKNGGNYLNTYNYNSNSNFNNKYRKHSFQSQSNNWNDSNYNNNTNYTKNGISNYHQHSNYSNNHNYNDDSSNDNLGYNKSYDNHHNSSFHKKNNFKGSYSSRHYYNEKNNNKIKNKSNRKNSNYGTGTYLVEVSTTPKKEENENNENDNDNKDNIEENKEEKNEIEQNDIKKEVDDNKKEKENIILNNDNNKEDKKEEKEENNILLTNEINISQDMEKEENQDNIKNNEKENNINTDINGNEEDNKLDIDNNEDYDNNFDFKLTDFNSLNPFNDKKINENEINSDKEDSDNNLRAINITPDYGTLNLNEEDKVEDDNNENNSYILNIINNSENLIPNNLYEEDNKEENYPHNEPFNEINTNNDKEDKENINNEIESKEQNIIKDDILLKSSPKEELTFSNSANNINERINLPDNKEQSLNENNLINSNNNDLRSTSDNTLMNMNRNNLNKNNVDVYGGSSQNNNNLSNEQLFKILGQNNSLLNSNSNLSKTNLNNNILTNANNVAMNLMSNISSSMNLLNLINDQVLIPNNAYYNNELQNNINIFFNYLDQEHNLLSSIKPNSKSKNNQVNKQNNIDFLKAKSDKLTNEYNNKIKKIKEKNPSLVKEYMNLFEEKIILPLYQKICEENQLKKELYTDTYNKYKNLIMKILENNNMKNTQIEPYGSIVNNFMTESGDIDICLIPEDLNTISDFDTYLEEIKEEAVINQKCAKLITLESYSKFMILKLKDIETDIDIDITVQNILPIINTKLIRCYSLYDQRFHILGIFLKFWVKKNQIHGALDKFLSSYALLILIIHYLQTIIEPKVLPILQQIQNKKKDYIYHNGEKEILTNLYFEEDYNEIKKYMGIVNCDEENECSVVELLVGFFEYYAYKYNHYMISISRSDKIAVDKNETIAFPLEDPFDIGYNPGKSMKLNNLQYFAFIYCMKKELNNILSGEYFKYGIEE